MGKITITNASTITKTGNNFYMQVNNLVHKLDYTGSLICDRLPTGQNSRVMDWNEVSGYIDNNGQYPNSNWIYWAINGITTIADMKSWLANNPLNIIYELKDPVVYQLTPQEITTLIGQNNIWTDTGDVNVTYGAYMEAINDHSDIEDKITRSMLGPIENGTTASQAYSQGQYFIKNNQFCKVKTSIASGATFTLGTNYEVTTVAAALIALQS